MDIEEGIVKQSNFNTNLETTYQLTTSWNGSASNDEVLFTFIFEAAESGYLHDFLTINSDYTIAEAYDKTEKLMQVNLEFQANEAIIEFQLDQNAPNPFQTTTMIGFTLPTASEAILKVMDIQGKVLKTVRGQFAKGYNQIYLDRKTLGARGVLYYQLEAGEYIANKKMIVLDTRY